jgi:hypothetical protein
LAPSRSSSAGGTMCCATSSVLVVYLVTILFVLFVVLDIPGALLAHRFSTLGIWDFDIIASPALEDKFLEIKSSGYEGSLSSSSSCLIS